MAFFRNPPMIWTELHDELLCREAILVQPYGYKQSTRERGNAWTRIAEVLNTIEEPKFYVTQRGVRERFNLLVSRFKAKTSDEIRKSGIDVPDQTPVDTLLEDIIIKINEFEIEFSQEKSKKEENNIIIQDIRQQALETLGETRKRKENEQEEQKTKKKRRSSGGDTVSFLREKAEKDHEFKLMQLQTQQKNQEEQVKQQHQQQQMQQQMFLLLQQQQQATMTILEKLLQKKD